VAEDSESTSGNRIPPVEDSRGSQGSAGCELPGEDRASVCIPEPASPVSDARNFIRRQGGYYRTVGFEKNATADPGVESPVDAAARVIHERSPNKHAAMHYRGSEPRRRWRRPIELGVALVVIGTVGGGAYALSSSPESGPTNLQLLKPAPTTAPTVVILPGAPPLQPTTKPPRRVSSTVAAKPNTPSTKSSSSPKSTTLTKVPSGTGASSGRGGLGSSSEPGTTEAPATTTSTIPVVPLGVVLNIDQCVYHGLDSSCLVHLTIETNGGGGTVDWSVSVNAYVCSNGTPRASSVVSGTHTLSAQPGQPSATASWNVVFDGAVPASPPSSASATVTAGGGDAYSSSDFYGSRPC